VKGILATVDDIEGGYQPLSVPSTSVRDAQEADGQRAALVRPHGAE
jgi:hypothetical protein